MTPVLARRRVLAVTVGLLLVLAGCAGQAAPSASPSDLPSTAPTPPLGSPTPSPTASATNVPTAAPTPNASFDPARVNLGLVAVARGLVAPIFATGAGDGSGRIFIVEQAGRIRILGADGKLAATPFLDISARVLSGGEQGLLGLAFHPDYAPERPLLRGLHRRATATPWSPSSRARDAGTADPGSERVLLPHRRIPTPTTTAGCSPSAPTATSTSASATAGAAATRENGAQSLATLLGKLLRIDVDGPAPYAIPATNPFVSRAGARPEIFDYGLRNPWRFSFDRATGDLFIGDVGQGAWEEVDAVPAGQPRRTQLRLAHP